MDASNPNQIHRQGLESFGLNQHPYGGSQTSPVPPPYGLSRFYGMRMSEDPWVPKTSIVPSVDPHTGQQMQSMVNYNSNGASFQNFRNRTLPSECDTAPDDSGYGSIRAPYSIENTSVYEGESSTETHQTANLMESLQLCPRPVPNSQSSAWGQPQPASRTSATPASAEHKHFCEHCQSWLRTKSELNKHGLRHNKPFHCDVPGCNRRKGFGTKNDLDRHKRSVHSDLTVSGPRYVCRLEQCTTRGPLKIWPRADNFRSHLRRIHRKDLAADADLEEYIYHDTQPPTQDSGRSQPALREDLQGVGGLSYMITSSSTDIQKPVGNAYPPSSFSNTETMVTDSLNVMPDIGEDLDSLLQDSHSTTAENADPTLDQAQAPEQRFMQPDILNEVSQPSLHSRQALNNQRIPLPSARLHYSTKNQGNVRDVLDISMGHDSGTSVDINVSEASLPRLNRSDTKDDHTKASFPSGDILKLLHSGSADKVIECLKHIPKNILNRALEAASDDAKSSSSQESTAHRNAHPCTECSKTFHRQCELKKHLKRHEKPYGCTFRNCSKSFGSKNDWKRHESSQHWQLETWKCEERRPNQTEPCGKVCQRRESFKNHLNKEHAITDDKEVGSKLEKCRVGRHCDTRFWCGFCQKIVEIGEEGVNAWTKRCDHIDDHFCGRIGPKRNICTWKHLEDEEPEKDGTESGGKFPSRQLTPSTDSSLASRESSGLKRKLSSSDMSSHKKQRQEEAYIWICVM
ncbi:hypothetical protein BGZ63DRAFT_214132 [Mariannaea sp. PMI_226]|nr:hypothetical protein BGZ63DRAFT_214132 [Mariannaea sp. PMI_226]